MKVIEAAKEGFLYTCPCCGYPNLEERGGFEICSICSWQDDGQDAESAHEVWGGPNSNYSLAEARANFEEHFSFYRPEDPAFEGERDRRIWAMQVVYKLQRWRWKGRVRETAEILDVLESFSRRKRLLLSP